MPAIVNDRSMDTPSNATAASRGTGPRGVLPSNWEAVAGARGYDPQEVQMQKDTYGWTVGQTVVSIQRPVRVVDASQEIAFGSICLCVGILFAVFANHFRSSIPEGRSTQTTGG